MCLFFTTHSSRSWVTTSPRGKKTPKRTYRKGMVHWRRREPWICVPIRVTYGIVSGERRSVQTSGVLMFARAYSSSNWKRALLGLRGVGLCIFVVWAVLRDPPCATKWESGLSIFCFLVRRQRLLPISTERHLDQLCYWDGFIISTTASIWKRHEEAQLRHDLVCDGVFFGDFSGPRALVLPI